MESQNPKYQDLCKSEFLVGGGGCSGKSNTKYQDLYKSEFLRDWGRGFLESQNPKYQDLPKFQFLGEGVVDGGGLSRPTFLKYFSGTLKEFCTKISGSWNV